MIYPLVFLQTEILALWSATIPDRVYFHGCVRRPLDKD